MLAVSNGRLVALSTPWGKRGWWYQSWVSQESWERFEIPATMCPRISRTFLEEEHRALGEWWFKQEYGCEFMETEDQLFSRDLIDGMLDAEVQPLFNNRNEAEIIDEPDLIDREIEPLDCSEE